MRYLIENFDLQEQGSALDIDISPESLQDEEGYYRLRAEIKATLNARFLRGQDLSLGPIVLTPEDKEYLLECAKENGWGPEDLTKKCSLFSK